LSGATDKNLSISASEFVWEDSDVPEAHAYLMPVVLKSLRDADARTVLDLGCGNGSGSAELQSQGFVVTGSDVSASGIALARRAHPGVNFIEHDVSRPLPASFREHFDAVVSLEVIEHLMRPRQVVDRAFEGLRAGGIFIASTPFHGYWKNLALAITNSFDNHWHPLRDFGHVKFFSKKTLFPLIRQSGFSIEKSMQVGRIPVLARSIIVIAKKV
jgi:2-polyprenyl-3-methyl-5-hydroxy-6-metoxy-1,4-benzoquinol methylase